MIHKRFKYWSYQIDFKITMIKTFKNLIAKKENFRIERENIFERIKWKL